MADIILNEEQKRIVKIKPNGLMIIKGVAGSGKTTVAVERFSTLLLDYIKEQEEATIISFTNSLTKYMLKLFNEKQILGLPKLNIQLVYEIYRNFLRRNNKYKVPVDQQKRREILLPIYEKHKEQNKQSIVFSKDIQFVLDEFEFIQSNICCYHEDKQKELMKEFEEYKSIIRSGREIRNFREQARQIIWDMYIEYYHKLLKNKLLDYPTFYYEALKYQMKKKRSGTFQPIYNYMIIDEAQDLSKVQMKFLINLWNKEAENSNIIIICDVAQRIYKNQYTWKSIGLDAVGHAYILRKNYRNTVEIARAAVEILKQDEDLTREEDFIQPEFSTRCGQKPVLNHFIHWRIGEGKTDYKYEEKKYICKKIKALIASKEFSNEDIVILSPSKSYLNEIQSVLNKMGYPTQLISGNKSDFQPNHISLCTMHSIKGLEFPVVFIVGINENQLGKKPFEEEENIERNKMDLKLLYTSMTRAKERLYISSYCGYPSPFLVKDRIDYTLFSVDDGVICRPFYDITIIKNEHEKVREWFKKELIEIYGYSALDIEKEFKVSFGTRNGYVDLMVYHNVDGKRIPYIAVEIKSRGVDSGEHQLLSYFSSNASVKYGVYTNGHFMKVYEKRVVAGKIVAHSIKDLPTYAEVLEEETIELPFTKKTKIPIIRVNVFDRSKLGFQVPVVNYSAAGSPLNTQERFDGNIFIPESFAKDERIVAVKIKGDSMMDIGIEDGSVVLVKTGTYFQSGVIGIVNIKDQNEWGTTCKKITYENGHYRLTSLNEKKGYKDIFVKEEDMRYIGEVIGIYEEIYE
ncbi:UvrD-helicase domain-containing protein [Crassaminicella indica]|uniref:DNA 3'-5' helicase n=1 Tax=Crassaminicella indica TaxID=2855394 RepID=A0ABX8RBL5_9CLOT|nr:UvrD-helicase domain-containing protein [Crassaminicella indica]QXM06450.1 type I restriction enzyme HsdR N-terminal domain-containing protein [Crassaminicella indica]